MVMVSSYAWLDNVFHFSIVLFRKTIIDIADEFVEEMLPVVHDGEGGKQFGTVLVFNDAIGGIAISRDPFLLEGHQGSAHVFGRGDEQWMLVL